MKKVISILIMVVLLFGISCTEKEVNPAIKETSDLISSIGTVSLDSKETLDEISELYESLTDEEKKQVTNYSLYEYKLNEYNNLYERSIHPSIEIMEEIDALPNVYQYTDEEKALIDTIKERYDALSDEEKTLVTNYSKLEQALESFQTHTEEERINSLKEQAQEVNNLINQIPQNLSYSTEERSLISTIETKYNALSSEVKAYVLNYEKVTNAKVKFEQYDAEQKVLKEKENAEKVIKQINSLGSIDLSKEALVTSARSAYNALTENEKAYVTNLNILEKAESTINDYKLANTVISLINALPETIALTDEAKINTASNKYKALTSSQQSLVTNYDKLSNAIKALEELKKSEPATSFKVYFVLNGGTLSGLKEEESETTTTKCSFVINSYNCNFWSIYQQEAVIYSQSAVIQDGGAFTYNIVVGFVKENNYYRVNQIIPDGTAFTDTTRKSSDYFIICNGTASSYYSTVSSISLNDQLMVSTTLGDASTTSLNATVSVVTTTTSSSGKKYMEYTGTTTLPKPTLYGKNFAGWYANADLFGDEIIDVYESITVYASWTSDKGVITTETILNSVSDYVASDTVDDLISSNEDATFKWSSSNSNLYKIENGQGKTIKAYQTHKNQKVTVSVTINYKTGGSKTLSKEITILPVKYADLPSTPIATYFSAGAASSYRAYSSRYKQTGVYFSESTKNTLDIVYYSSITPYADGTVSLYSESTFNSLIDLKNYDTRIVASIDGVSTETAAIFYKIGASDTLSKTFAKNLLDLCEKYNLDGLDIDWEYNSNYPTIASSYTRVMKAIREEMNSRQDAGGTPYMLTAALPANSWSMTTERYNFQDLNTYLDYINLMSYDLNKTNVASHLCPMYSSSYDKGYGFGAYYGVSKYSAMGFSKSKILLGCAGYGKAYKVTGTASNASYPGLGATATLTRISEYASAGSFASGTVYGNVIDALEANSKYKKYIEYNASGKIVGSYLYSETDKIFVTYDSSEVITAKYNFANEVEGMGLMCWAYTEDMSDHYVNTCASIKNK